MGCTSLKNVYYEGSKEQWDKIEFYKQWRPDELRDANFEELNNATIHYNSNGSTATPDTSDTSETPAVTSGGSDGSDGIGGSDGENTTPSTSTPTTSDGNPVTGIALAVAPVVLAGAAVAVVALKKKIK